MQDDFNPERFSITHASGEPTLVPAPEGEWVAWINFLIAKQSRDHWKHKVARWEAEAKSQETVIQNLERLLSTSYNETENARTEIERLRADVKRLTSIIDHNTSDDGRDLRRVTEDNIRLRQMLADIYSISSKPV